MLLILCRDVRRKVRWFVLYLVDLVSPIGVYQTYESNYNLGKSMLYIEEEIFSGWQNNLVYKLMLMMWRLEIRSQMLR